MFYITGDTHGEFSRIEQFCERIKPTRDDTIIILGDAGINYYGGWRDIHKKQRLAKLPITLFAIHGNHEMRPGTLPCYHTMEWNGGQVYVEEAYDMSISVTGYTEAKIEGKWCCIDFFQYDMNGHVHHIPCIEGQSMVHTALQWDCDMDRIGVPTDLSPQVKAECTGRDGKLFGQDDPHWNPWHMVRGSWFGSVDLDQPEYCGYFPRQAVADYLSNPREMTLDEDDMIPVEEYRELPEEEKKAYQYYEFTSPYGNRAILRDFKRAVQARIDAWNSEIAFCKDHMQISLSDVRVLLIIG